MGRHDTPSGSEDEAPARREEIKVKQERFEIVGMEGDQETAPEDSSEQRLRAGVETAAATSLCDSLCFPACTDTA